MVNLTQVLTCFWNLTTTCYIFDFLSLFPTVST